MTTHAQTEQWGYRLGRSAGHAGGWLARADRKANGYLVAQGMNANLARGMLWAVKLALLALLLYGAFWVALLLVSAAVAVWAARFSSSDHADDYPFTMLDELRKMPGYDPNFYNDASHEMYEDD
ncbi:hypothetical protein FACS189475_08520 [Betaproteobacteria bacterium]|nr:hypothetical protein FACS189475_08520 [Betaproteobacteria bacterium]